ncbi:hypothetical protein GGX14DRAFT_658132 [Mycena pura]|uniref:Uncharacterized protein n=1 Tax=Mycena pura TaxID=153505 RepID=A0AAD6YM59_9AGAR|nr:hypothetical protein GGX14DRAFT_658132 [Mycena pura]
MVRALLCLRSHSPWILTLPAMGWYDDVEEAKEARELAGYEMWNKWYRDPQPAGASASGPSQPARVERPESEWDETKWRRSNLREGDTMAKGKAKTTYLLTDKDLLPLEYQKQVNSRGFAGMKMYRKREVERLGWKKYGGPNGLKAAKEDKKNGIKPTSPKKATGTGKTTSSTSAATAAKVGVLGKGKGKAISSGE